MTWPRHCLVVEDDPDIRTIITINLEMEGFTLRAVSTVAEAERELAAGTFDLILLDVMLPDRDGLSFLAQLRAEAATADVPVVLLTAKADDASVFKGWQAGASYYLTKPFHPEELLRFLDLAGTGGDPAAVASASSDLPELG